LIGRAHRATVLHGGQPAGREEEKTNCERANHGAILRILL
jgi:hypothetical protein